MGVTRKIVLLCEDQQQETFLTTCMKELGASFLHRHIVKWIASKEELGGNVESVINRVNNYEFRSWQAICAKRKLLLVVVADADEGQSVVERAAEFPAAGANDDNKLYVVIVPKRNIETWIALGLNLKNCAAINEDTDYKGSKTTARGAGKKAAKVLTEQLDSPDRKVANNQVWTTFADAMERLRVGISIVMR